MVTNIPDFLFPFSTGATVWLIASLLLLIWIGASRVPQESGQPVTTGFILTFALLGWYALAHYLGQQNTYWAPNNPLVPTIQFGILLPVIIAMPLLLRSTRIARLIDVIPMSWLVGVQFYRVLGLIFLILWWGGHLPWQFALPAGIGDVATGLLALVIAGMLAGRVSGAHRAAYAWCLFGLFDLVVAFATGFMTSPGTGHILSMDAPNMLITAYPLVMVPTFAVPVSILLHGLCLWKLARIRIAMSATRTASS